MSTLEEVFPEIAAEWDYDKNGNITPSQIKPQSNIKFWWRCKYGHPSWEATPNTRAKNSGCPYCSGRRRLVGENDFATLYPDLVKEWDYDKNKDIAPDQISPYSNKKVHWKCSKGHGWKATVGNRTLLSRGCPYCRGRYAIPGVNDLATRFPDLAKQWHPTLNEGLLPQHILPGAQKNIWWQCERGHPPWKATPNNRTSRGTGCPYCANRKLLQGDNDLATARPDLAAEWCYERNGDITPEMIFPGSNQKFWWQCKNGHPPWEAPPNSRSTGGTGCPHCANERKSPHFRPRDKLPLSPELAAEWCYERNGDTTPDSASRWSRQAYWWQCKNGHPPWKASIAPRSRGSECPYCTGRRAIPGVNDLATMRPDLASQWVYALNDPVTPDKVTHHSGIYVWWQCDQGHPPWKSAVCVRAKGHGCPYCAGQKALPDTSDLATLRPDLVSEWDFEKNGHLMPSDFTEASHQTVSWKCRFGHPSWTAPIYSRTRDADCPYCAGKLPIKGVNDLATLRPDLAAEWDYSRNKPVTPADILPQSNKKYWWTCRNGHPSWRAKVCNRSTGHNCPYCSGRIPIPGVSDLATIRPDIAAEWDYENNKDLSPAMFTPFSHKVVYWVCPNGHPPWQTSIGSRSNGGGCPYCSGRTPIPNVTDLATLRPDLAAEWDYERNKDLTPESVTISYSKKVWWRCPYGHPSWETTVVLRSNGSGCPHCAERVPITGATDLATLRPDLAAEWDYERNGNLTPKMVTAFSSRKAFWTCPSGHPSWEATVSSRSSGSGCPYCAGHIPIPNVTDLATLRPDLAEEWDYEENDGLVPSMFTLHSNVKIRWRCTKASHSWRAAISSRANGSGCPYCKGFRKISYPACRKFSNSTEQEADYEPITEKNHE